eukprot:jgi/Mesen1/9165/ME000591S08486
MAIIVSTDVATRVLVGAAGRALFYPSLLYNVNVVLGAVPFPGDVHILKGMGVNAVVTLNEPHETLVPSAMYKEYGMEHLEIPTRDYLFAPSKDDLQRAVDFIHEYEQMGQKVYVHCKAGRGRSTTVVLCYLVKHQDMSPQQALDYVRARRPRVLLAAAQWKAVMGFYKSLQGNPHADISLLIKEGHCSPGIDRGESSCHLEASCFRTPAGSVADLQDEYSGMGTRSPSSTGQVAASSCPTLLTIDEAQWMEHVEHILPELRHDGMDEGGCPLPSASVLHVGGSEDRQGEEQEEEIALLGTAEDLEGYRDAWDAGFIGNDLASPLDMQALWRVLQVHYISNMRCMAVKTVERTVGAARASAALARLSYVWLGCKSAQAVPLSAAVASKIGEGLIRIQLLPAAASLLCSGRGQDGRESPDEGEDVVTPPLFGNFIMADNCRPVVEHSGCSRCAMVAT